MAISYYISQTMSRSSRDMPVSCKRNLRTTMNRWRATIRYSASLALGDGSAAFVIQARLHTALIQLQAYRPRRNGERGRWRPSIIWSCGARLITPEISLESYCATFCLLSWIFLVLGCVRRRCKSVTSPEERRLSGSATMTVLTRQHYSEIKANISVWGLAYLHPN